MGIRAHVQTTQPEYGNTCLTSWLDHDLLDLLRRNKCTVRGDDTDQWEIDADKKLYRLIKRLRKDYTFFDHYITDKGMRGDGYGDEVLKLLEEGVRACEEKGYDTIRLDWW